MPACFVIMPFGHTTESHTEDYWSDHFEYFIKPAIEGASNGKRLLGYEAKLSDPAGGGIVGDIFSSLQEADVVLADLTDFNPNVMYELGIRHCLRDRTIMILEAELPIPFYFQNYKVVRYSKRTPKDIAQFRENIQRRLVELSQNEPSPWDNPLSDYFRGMGQKVMLVSRQGPDMTMAGLRESGLSTIYVPSTNAERNVRKEDVVCEAEEHIRLLATTGHSYLATVGSRFKGALVGRLNAGIPVQLILLNPWTDSAVLLALGELAEGFSTEIQALALERLEHGSLSGFDPIALIEDSVYYRHKYPESIEGYVDLRRQFGSKIELRLSELDIAATILLTEKAGFFEPYIHVNLPERMRSLMLTFEVEFSRNSYLYPHSNAYLDTLWKLSIPYEKLFEIEDEWKERIRRKYT